MAWLVGKDMLSVVCFINRLNKNCWMLTQQKCTENFIIPLTGAILFLRPENWILNGF